MLSRSAFACTNTQDRNLKTVADLPKRVYDI